MPRVTWVIFDYVIISFQTSSGQPMIFDYVITSSRPAQVSLWSLTMLYFFPDQFRSAYDLWLCYIFFQTSSGQPMIFDYVIISFQTSSGQPMIFDYVITSFQTSSGQPMIFDYVIFFSRPVQVSLWSLTTRMRSWRRCHMEGTPHLEPPQQLPKSLARKKVYFFPDQFRSAYDLWLCYIFFQTSSGQPMIFDYVIISFQTSSGQPMIFDYVITSFQTSSGQPMIFDYVIFFSRPVQVSLWSLTTRMRSWRRCHMEGTPHLEPPQQLPKSLARKKVSWK